MNKVTFLTVRLSVEDHKAFGVKAKEYGGQSFILREIVKAFNEDRIILKPSAKERKSLYSINQQKPIDPSQLTFNFPE